MSMLIEAFVNINVTSFEKYDQRIAGGECKAHFTKNMKMFNENFVEKPAQSGAKAPLSFWALLNRSSTIQASCIESILNIALQTLCCRALFATLIGSAYQIGTAALGYIPTASLISSLGRTLIIPTGITDLNILLFLVPLLLFLPEAICTGFTRAIKENPEDAAIPTTKKAQAWYSKIERRGLLLQALRKSVCLGYCVSVLAKQIQNLNIYSPIIVSFLDNNAPSALLQMIGGSTVLLSFSTAALICFVIFKTCQEMHRLPFILRKINNIVPLVLFLYIGSYTAGVSATVMILFRLGEVLKSIMKGQEALLGKKQLSPTPTKELSF